MRIGVNCLMLNDEYAGLGIYTINLLNHLAKITAHEFYVLSSRPATVKELLDSSFYIEHIPMKNNRLSRIYAEQVRIPKRAHLLDLDVLFTPAFYMPLFTSCYSLVTIHDLIHKTYPKDMSLHTRMIMNLFLDQGIRRANQIIAVSDCTKKDIERYLKRTDKIEVIYEGLGNQITTNQVSPDYLGETDRFALIVGSMMPRKNVLGMVQAFQLLEDRQGLKLVIAGHKGYEWEIVKNYIIEHDLSSEVIITGYVSTGVLNWLYGHARMLLYCSYYEGFGFPPLEAMKNGVPVIASDRSSIPEIVGDAALLIDPDDIAQISQSIGILDRDEHIRQKLIEAGTKRVGQFSWDKAARHTEHLLDRIEGELSR